MPASERPARRDHGLTRRRWRIGALIVAGLTAAALAAGYLYHRHTRFDMARELARIADAQALWDDPWERGVEKAQDLEAELKGERDPARRFQLEREIARHYVYAGKPEIAVGLLSQWLDRAGATLPPAAVQSLKTELALAYLRVGELQNCTWNHSTESCLFPIQGQGTHRHRLGSTQAIGVLEELLAAPDAPEDEQLAWRWLLNIAYMTLGQFPDQVPAQWVLPQSALAAQADIGRFVDVAESRGVAHFGRAGGAILDDFTNDGHLDLLLGSWGSRDPLGFYRNDGKGRFTSATAAAGLAGITGGLHMVQADYDNDGWLDVLVLRGAWLHERGRIPNSLLRNNGDGSFTDVTEAAGLLSYYPTQTASWADIDGDGFLDLFIGNEFKHEQVPWPAEAKNFELYLNDRRGGFREIGAESGMNLRGMIKGAAFGDIDNDGRPDLYVSMMGAPNHLLRNTGVSAAGIPQFVDVTAPAGVAGPSMSFACWFWDYDNDGWEDLFVFGYQADLPQIVRDVLGQPARGERPRLYHNLGNGQFRDVTADAGLGRLILAMGSNFGDLDNDGWLDFYAGTGSPAFNMLVPNRMFRSDSGQRFQDVTASGGFGHLQKGHAVSFGDIDSDGDQDIFELIGGAYTGDAFYSVLFENPGHRQHWITLRLEGSPANRFGVGARIRVELRNADGSARSIFRTVSSGGSFGASSLQQEIGLGTASAIERIEVHWPGSGTRHSIPGPIAMDRIYTLRQTGAPLEAAAP